MEINYDKTNIISRYDYNFIIEHKKNRNIENYEIILENYSNEKILITIYQFNDEYITKYFNTFTAENFINQSIYIKCILLMTKNKENKIQKILRIIKNRLDIDKKNNSNNLVYNGNSLNFRIKKVKNSEDKFSNVNYNETIHFNLYITLINLQKEKITLNLKQIKLYSFSKQNMPNIIFELFEQNKNMIQDLSNMEKELIILKEQKNDFREILKKCDNYYGQSIKMKMELMDDGIDSDIFKSKEDFFFIKNNVSKRMNKKIKQIKQIYKASSNGDNVNALFNNCASNQNFVILIFTEDKKCFGGFTQNEWEVNKYKYDPCSFLFSLNNKEIYPILPQYEKMAINSYEDTYPIIFGNDIYLSDCFFSSENNIAQEGYYDYTKSKIKNDYKLNGKKYFCVNELEVYQFDFFD